MRAVSFCRGMPAMVSSPVRVLALAVLALVLLAVARGVAEGDSIGANGKGVSLASDDDSPTELDAAEDMLFGLSGPVDVKGGIRHLMQISVGIASIVKDAPPSRLRVEHVALVGRTHGQVAESHYMTILRPLAERVGLDFEEALRLMTDRHNLAGMAPDPRLDEPVPEVVLNAMGLNAVTARNLLHVLSSPSAYALDVRSSQALIFAFTNACAPHYLAVLLSTGIAEDVLPHDEAAAVQLEHLAARVGCWHAEAALADRYLTGRGVPEFALEGLRRLLFVAEDAFRWETMSKSGYDTRVPMYPALLSLREYNNIYEWEDPLLSEDTMDLEEEAAELGNLEAKVRRVWRMAQGVGRDEDLEGAYDELAQLDPDNAAVQFNRGVMAFHGHGRRQNVTEAVELFKRSAGQGYANAHRVLGVLYHHGAGGMAANQTQARIHFETAAAHPHYEPIALYQLGHYHRLGLGGLTKNVTRALNYYFEADYRNYFHAPLMIGKLLAPSFLVDLDAVNRESMMTEGIDYVTSDKGEAEMFLRNYVLRAWGVPALEEARELHDGWKEKRYDEKGKPVAIVHHAPDYWQALFKYAQASEVGVAAGSLNAAWMVYRGKGYRGQHQEQAAIRLALAATQQELGHDVAGWIADLGYNLAGDVFYRMTEEGLDLGPDPGKPSGSVLNALDYYIGDASDQEVGYIHAAAMYHTAAASYQSCQGLVNLAWMYACGLGVPPNQTMAVLLANHAWATSVTFAEAAVALLALLYHRFLHGTVLLLAALLPWALLGPDISYDRAFRQGEWAGVPVGRDNLFPKGFDLSQPRGHAGGPAVAAVQVHRLLGDLMARVGIDLAWLWPAGESWGAQAGRAIVLVLGAGLAVLVLQAVLRLLLRVGHRGAEPGVDGGEGPAGRARDGRGGGGNAVGNAGGAGEGAAGVAGNGFGDAGARPANGVRRRGEREANGGG